MTTKLNLKQSLIAGLLAGITAAVINAILFFIFHGAGVISDNIYPQPNKPLTVVPVIITSIIPAIIASLVFFLLEKFTNKGFKIFAIVSLILMLLSLYNPFGVIPGVTTGYALVLCVMHIIVPLSLLYFINKARQSKHVRHSNTSYQTLKLYIMAKGYWIANSDVNDMEGLMKYRAANREIMTKYGAKFIVMHGQQIVVEPTYRSKQTIVEFPTYKDAVDCFNTPEYKAAVKLRYAVAKGSMVIAEGYDGPQGMDL